MNAKTIAVSTLLLAAQVLSVAAQSPTPAAPPPLPPGPSVQKRASDFAHWTVTAAVKNPPGAKDQPATSQIVTDITKTGDTWHVLIRGSDNMKADIWGKGASQVTIRPEWKEPLLSSGENHYDAARLDFSSTDFAGFEWVSPKEYVGQAKMGGRDCIIYKAEVPDYEPDPLEKALGVRKAGPKMTTTTAYVDLETRLPVALVTAQVAKGYKFGDPPSEKVTLPPEAQASIDAWDKKRRILVRKPDQP